MECDPKSKFQFRKVRYTTGEVIENVLKTAKSDRCLPRYDRYLNENAHRIQKPSPEQIRKFGKELERIYDKKMDALKQDAVREVLNCGFQRVINGGTRSHLEFLPTDPMKINEDHVCKTLLHIRGVRLSTVRRNYSSR